MCGPCLLGSGTWVAAEVGPISTILIGIILVVFASLLIAMGLCFLVIARAWLRAFLSGAPVTVWELLGMMLRRSPMKDIVGWRIRAAQLGLPVTTAQLESAHLQGVRVERAILAMAQAKEVGKDVGWEDILSADREGRLKELL